MGCDVRLPAQTEIKLPEILSALSFALDLTEGAIPGHALRSTLLGMRLATALDLPVSTLTALYYALQLKDVGCSSNSARVAQLFGGDDRLAKAMTKTTDWTGLLRASPGSMTLHSRLADVAAGLRAVPRNLKTLWTVVLPGAPHASKVKRIADLGKNSVENLRHMTELRCDRGAQILHKLEMSDMACEAVRHLDERWDGRGYPEALAGDRVPLLSRIAAIVQSLDVFATTHGVREAMRTLERRSGSWFDPSLVKVVLALYKQGRLWENCEPGCTVDLTRRAVVLLSPTANDALGAEQIDAICEAFSDVVDAKSPFTFRHSIGVTAITRALSNELGLPPRRVQLLQRAALLHDIGKLGIPNSILDKPGRLTDTERTVITEHPVMSQTILARITGFEELARIAGEHHERLDGTGYPNRLQASQLSLESRVLSVADCFSALVEQRPYRAALPVDEAMAILRQDVPQKLDPMVFSCLETVVARWGQDLPSVFQPSTEPASCDLQQRVLVPA